MEASQKREFRVENEHVYNTRSAGAWVVSHMRRYPLLPALLVLAAIVNNFGYSYIQVYVGKAFDIITKSGWLTHDLLLAAVGVLVASSAQGLTGILRNFAVEFLAQRIERDAREELYISLLGKSQTFYGRQHIGDIMARATNDVHQLNMMFSPGVAFIIDSLLALVVPVIVIATIDYRLLIAPLAFTVLLVITLADYTRKLGPVSIGQRVTFGEMNGELAEAVAGIEVVKANARENHEWLRFAAKAKEYRDLFIRQGRVQARYLPMLMFSIAWAGAFIHGLYLWRVGIISLGQVVAFMGLMSTLRYTTFMSIFTFNLVQLGIASAKRILELITAHTDLDQNEKGTARPINGEVAFEGVGFGYDGQMVLRDISFTARPGETVAIVGHTGSGKTTLTRLINRIFDVSQGRVLVDGTDVREWSLESLRSQISTIEQDVFLFSRTIFENIAFADATATLDAVRHVAEEAQAREFIEGFPDGYQTVVGERGVTLSGGQRQRIAIARAFLTNPRILILDDSTSAIDSATEDQIQRAMHRIAKNRTTFIITHRLSQIRWADRILVLRQGTIVDQGTHDELLARSADYRRIFAQYD
ncbi:MAG TPA: ABC transporter ATP-binding protein [Spirochaetia bacterium]|nr:ABC transporter ATP-binding protein [Spirochaetia bacterium]